MYNSSLPLRLCSIAAISFVLVTTTCITPQSAFARRVESRTRTSVHYNHGHRPPPRHMDRNTHVNINKNVNVNVRDDRRYHDRRYYDRRYYYDRRHYHSNVGGAFAVGALTGLAIGSIITAASLPPSCSTVYVSGYPYRQCGSTWLQPQYQGSQVTYVVINPPR